LLLVGIVRATRLSPAPALTEANAVSTSSRFSYSPISVILPSVVALRLPAVCTMPLIGFFVVTKNSEFGFDLSLTGSIKRRF
jgi:hypothetical protein